MTESDIASRPTVVITGPTSGIGARMLQSLVSHPSQPSIVLMGRDADALDRAMAQVQSKGLRAHRVHVDLSDLVSVRTAIEEVAAGQQAGDIDKVDVSLLNAGAQFATASRTGAQGYELTFTVNVISQHLLLRGLEPFLAPAAHTIVMGSSTHRGKRASFNLVPDPEWRVPFELARAEASVADARVSREQGGVAYASSKLALVTLSHDWATRLASAGKRLNVYDPGLVPGTGLGKDLPPYMYWVWRNMMPLMRVLPGASSPANSGSRAVQLAMGDTYPKLNDGYVEIDRLTEAEQVTFAADRREQLWAWLEQTVRPFLPAL